jgi:hypothetical protein
MPINLVSQYPLSGAMGVPLGATMLFVFDTPLDPSSIGKHSIFIEGSDKEVLSGPFVPVTFEPRGQAQVLSDPAYYGLVQGKYVWEYLTTAGSAVDTAFEDISGTEDYYTKILFQPTYPLSPNHPYQIYIVGTSSSVGEVTGLKTRTVFDVIEGGGNAGDGEVVPYGGYMGTNMGTFHVSVLQGGRTGEATYRWNFNSEAQSPTILTHTYRRTLKHQVSLSFSLKGEFVSGDVFSFLVKPPDFKENVSIYHFTTGSEGLVIEPYDVNNIVSRVAPPLPNTSYPGLNLEHTIPENLALDLDTSTTSVQFVFNKTLDTNVTAQGIRIYIGPANGDTTIVKETSYNPNRFSITGSALTIYLENT